MLQRINARSQRLCIEMVHNLKSSMTEVDACALLFVPQCIITKSHVIVTCMMFLWFKIQKICAQPCTGHRTMIVAENISCVQHDDVIKGNYFPRYWPFVRGIHRSPANSSQRPVTRNFPLIWAWTKSWANNGDAHDLRRHLAHYDVTVMG